VLSAEILTKAVLDGAADITRGQERGLQNIRDGTGVSSRQVVSIERYVHSGGLPKTGFLPFSYSKSG
jgi:hypothetical protein